MTEIRLSSPQPSLPGVVLTSGQRVGQHFFEFFAAQIRNPKIFWSRSVRRRMAAERFSKTAFQAATDTSEGRRIE